MNIKNITCPFCHNDFYKNIPSTINLHLQPEKKEDVINGAFNIIICPDCKRYIVVKSPVLITQKQQWVWLLPSSYRHPSFTQEAFFSQLMPGADSRLIKQEVLFIEFGKPNKALDFVFSQRKPTTASEWVTLGRLFKGNKAIKCYKKALKIDEKTILAKEMLDKELKDMKTYSKYSY